MLAESHFGRALFAGTQNDHKSIMGYFGHMTRDINDTFVTNHPHDRKTLPCW